MLGRMLGIDHQRVGLFEREAVGEHILLGHDERPRGSRWRGRSRRVPRLVVFPARDEVAGESRCRRVCRYSPISSPSARLRSARCARWTRAPNMLEPAASQRAAGPHLPNKTRLSERRCLKECGLAPTDLVMAAQRPTPGRGAQEAVQPRPASSSGSGEDVHRLGAALAERVADVLELMVARTRRVGIDPALKTRAVRVSETSTIALARWLAGEDTPCGPMPATKRGSSTASWRLTARRRSTK